MYSKEAEAIVAGIIQSYIGPDQRVTDIPTLYRVLVQALRAAHEQGWKDRADAEDLTRH
jgi:hypothetical protein